MRTGPSGTFSNKYEDGIHGNVVSSGVTRPQTEHLVMFGVGLMAFSDIMRRSSIAMSGSGSGDGIRCGSCIIHLSHMTVASNAPLMSDGDARMLMRHVNVGMSLTGILDRVLAGRKTCVSP
jgi:hypothetical protein